MGFQGEVDIRAVVIRSLSRAIIEGKPIILSGYNPPPPTTPDEVLKDAIIRDTLKAIEEGRVPAFSGDSRDLVPEKSTKR